MRYKFLLLCVPGLSACAEARDVVGDGGCSVATSPDGWLGSTPPTFVEVWRAGGTNEGEELAMPILVAAAPDDRIAIVDFQLGLVGVASDGEWLGPLVQTGEGPGEVGMPLGAAWDEDGRLAVLDFLGGKSVFFDANGGYSREAPLNPTPVAGIMASGQVAGIWYASSGAAYAQSHTPSGEITSVTQAIVRVDVSDAADTVAIATSPSLGGEWPPARTIIAPGFPRLVFAVSERGDMAIAGDQPGYSVAIHRPDGSTIELCRTVEGVELRPDERGQDPDAAEDLAPLLDAIRDAQQASEPTPLGRLLYGRAGRLWVERDRPSPLNPLEALTGRAGARFDVYDPDGRLLGELTAPPGVSIVAAHGERVWGFEVGPFDETWVIAYELREGD